MLAGMRDAPLFKSWQPTDRITTADFCLPKCSFTSERSSDILAHQELKNARYVFNSEGIEKAVTWAKTPRIRKQCDPFLQAEEQEQERDQRIVLFVSLIAILLTYCQLCFIQS